MDRSGRGVAGAVGLSIVPATSDDHEALFAVFADVAADGGAEPRRDRTLREAFDEGWLRDRAVFVASLDGETVGGYFLRPNFPAFAAHIAQGGYLVARPFRRRGIGRALLLDSLDRARAGGYRAMMFNLVMADNPSRALYESVGFRVVGEIPKVHGAESAFIYWIELANGDSTGHEALSADRTAWT